MQPRVPRHRALDRAEPAIELTERGRARARARDGSPAISVSYGSRPYGCTSARMPSATPRRRARGVARARGCASVARARPPAAAPSSQTSCECECGKARAGGTALVDAARARSRRLRAHACFPRLRDRSDLAVAQLCERAHVARRVHDDLLPVERRIEVRHDAHRPGCLCAADAVRLGRRAVLSARAERALVELRLGRRPRSAPRRRRAGGGGSGRRRRAARRAGQPDLPARSRNGLIRSIGAGKMIVDVLPAPSSSSVWR